MSGTDVAGDCPGKFDLIVDGYGYVTARAVDPNMPFRVQQQNLSYTPTFIERTNVTGAYGDSQQDFFLTVSQNDWSGGQGQLFFHSADPNSIRRYYSGSGIITTPAGQVSVRPKVTSVTTVASVRAACGRGKAAFEGHAYASDTNLYTVGNTGTVTDQGAHGAGAVNQWGVCSDGVNIYIAGATKLRKWTGAAFSDFSATTNAGALAYLNNALYSCDGSTLKSYDGSGTATTLFTWKDATQTVRVALDQHPKIVPYGGKLLIYFPFLNDAPELWIYDGTGTSRVAVLSSSIVGYDLEVLNGIVYMSGQAYDVPEDGSTASCAIPLVMYYVNGTFGELWRAQSGLSGRSQLNGQYQPALGTVNGLLVIGSVSDNSFIAYDQGRAAFTNMGTLAGTSGGVGSATPMQISSTATSVLATWNDTNAVAASFYPGSTYPTSGTITSSQFDFDNALTKAFRGIKVDFTKSTNSAASVDIYYDVNRSGAGTLLQAGATSGTEYALTGVTGRTITVMLVLNDGLLSGVPGTHSVPTVRRLYVRGVPILQSYRMNEFILDLGGESTTGVTVRLRNGADHPLTGEQQRVHLASAIQSQTPLTITDRSGTYTGVLEAPNCEFDQTRSGQWYARIRIREI